MMIRHLNWTEQTSFQYSVFITPYHKTIIKFHQTACPQRKLALLFILLGVNVAYLLWITGEHATSLILVSRCCWACGAAKSRCYPPRLSRQLGNHRVSPQAFHTSLQIKFTLRATPSELKEPDIFGKCR